jgi:hypothetical protein
MQLWLRVQSNCKLFEMKLNQTGDIWFRGLCLSIMVIVFDRDQHSYGSKYVYVMFWSSNGGKKDTNS